MAIEARHDPMQRGGFTQRVVYEQCIVTADGNSWHGRLELRGDLWRLWFVADEGQAEFRADLDDAPPYVTRIEIKR